MKKHVFEGGDLAPRELGSKESDVERIDGAVFGGFVFCRVGRFDIGIAVAVQALSAALIFARASA